MNTAMQNQRRTNRLAARSRALADRNYRQIGYLDALLHAPRCPYPAGTRQAIEWFAGYEAGKREQAVTF